MTRIWTATGAALLHRPRRAWLALLVVTLLFAGGLTRLQFETSQKSLISENSHVFKVNQRYQQQFGGETLYTLYTGPVEQLFSPTNLPRMRALERELRATGDLHATLGPLTALQFAKNQLTVMPGIMGRASATDQMSSEVARLGKAGEQSLSNPAFVHFLLTGADGSIRPALRDNFIDENHALLVTRMPGNASIADQGRIADDVRSIVDRHPMAGFQQLTAGSPLLLKEINDYLRGGMATLGALAALVMLAVLWLVFRARYRLLSLGVVSLGLVWAFGALGYLGVPLSMVTISGLPILLGLGVDFAVQTHNRFDEDARTGQPLDLTMHAVMSKMAVPLSIAMAAAVAGFLALQLSKVPMIKDFGVLLAVGTAVMVIEAIVVVALILSMAERRRPTTPGPAPVGFVDRVVSRATTLAPRWAIALAAVGLVIAGAGFVVEGSTPIQTDPEAWVGDSGSSVQDLTALRQGTGYSTELDFSIRAHDVTSDEVVGWIDRYSRRELAAHPKALVHATSLPAMVSSVTGATPVGQDIDQLVSVAPPDVVRSFISSDRHRINLIFPIANLSLGERQALLDQMVADLDPPAGVTVEPSGLVVLGIELVNNLEAGRQVLTLTALGLVALWLLIVYRRFRTALLPLVPVTIAVGTSALVVYLAGLELTPLTTVSGPLAIAITTEFSVLLLSRFLEERAAGAGTDVAVDRAASRIGRAFLASGLTLLGGFVVLAFSPMPLLIDFGVIVAIDVALALISVLVVLPPLLRWADPSLPGSAPEAPIEASEPPPPAPRAPEVITR
jgi:hydrophobe/amphiphile efflux-3 (HAE3) family protein